MRHLTDARNLPRRSRSRRGAMLVLVAVTLVILVAMMVFSVDVAHMQLTRTQLRSSTDAAARAAMEALSREQSVDAAIAAAKATALANNVVGRGLQLADEDIHIGHSTKQGDGTYQFVKDGTPTNSVRIEGRRTESSLGGSVPLFFGHLLGRSDFEPSVTATSVNLDRDICLVVDRSGSMNRSATDSDPVPARASCDPPDATRSKWAALRVAVDIFVSALETTDQDELVGLVSYASDHEACQISYSASDIEQPLSSDYQQINAAMLRLSNQAMEGYTNIPAGIDDGVRVLTDASRIRRFAEKTMVLMTDGIQNRGRDVRDAARDAAAESIVIHTVTFGDGAQQGPMQEVAALTGGQHFHAPDAAELQRIFEEIAVTLPVVLTQ